MDIDGQLLLIQPGLHQLLLKEGTKYCEGFYDQTGTSPLGTAMLGREHLRMPKRESIHKESGHGQPQRGAMVYTEALMCQRAPLHRWTHARDHKSFKQSYSGQKQEEHGRML